jgi:hypothetical protein
VQDILSSPAPTFGKAVIASLNTDLSGLKDRWEKWIKKP